MRIGQVVGKVVLSRVHPSLVGAQFKIIMPLAFDDLVASSDADESPLESLKDSSQPRRWGTELVVYDNCSANIGEWMAFSEGAEAAAAFGPDKKAPVDAYAGAILDQVEINVAALDTLRKN